MSAAYVELPQASNTFMSWGVSSLNSLTTTELKPWHPRTEAPTRPADGSLKSCMKFMHEQLDCFGGDNLLLGKFSLLGNEERRTGGVPLHHLDLHTPNSYTPPRVGPQNTTL